MRSCVISLPPATSLIRSRRSSRPRRPRPTSPRAGHREAAQRPRPPSRPAESGVPDPPPDSDPLSSEGSHPPSGPMAMAGMATSVDRPRVGPGPRGRAHQAARGIRPDRRPPSPRVARGADSGPRPPGPPAAAVRAPHPALARPIARRRAGLEYNDAVDPGLGELLHHPLGPLALHGDERRLSPGRPGRGQRTGRRVRASGDPGADRRPGVPAQPPSTRAVAPPPPVSPVRSRSTRAR